MKTQNTTQTAKHTPTPWKYHLGRGIDPRMHIQTIGGYQIAQTPKNGISCGNEAINEANAEFICKAVNEHDTLIAQRDALLAELITITDAYAKAMKDAGVTHYPEALAIVRQSRAAIALCEQEKELV